jgi:hypothetical protein
MRNEWYQVGAGITGKMVEKGKSAILPRISDRGNMSRVAKTLGTSERIFGLRAKKYNIDLRRFRT